MSNSSIGPIDRGKSSASTPGQSGPGSNSNEVVLHISQSSRARTLPSDCLMSYPGHTFLVVGTLPLHRDAVDVLYRLAEWARKQ